MTDSRVNTIARPERQPFDTIPNEGDLRHEVQDTVQPLDEEVWFQEEDVARQIDEFCGATKG